VSETKMIISTAACLCCDYTTEWTVTRYPDKRAYASVPDIAPPTNDIRCQWQGISPSSNPKRTRFAASGTGQIGGADRVSVRSAGTPPPVTFGIARFNGRFT
jgi:hypothetical protein